MKSAVKFARQHKFVAALVLVFGLELIALPVVWWRYSLRNFPFHAFVDDFTIPRLTIGWLIVPPIAEGLPQAYIGNISTIPSKWTEIFPADLIFGWRLAPNKIARHAFAPYYYVTNSHGFAVTERFDEVYAVPKPPDTYRIVVLGSSTVLGAGVPDPRVALPAQLLKNLRQTPLARDKRIEVINAGVGGYTIYQEYLYLLTEVVAYQPDLVIAYNGWAEAGLSGMFNAFGRDANPFRSFEHRSINARLNDAFSLTGSVLTFAGNIMVAIGDLWSGSAIRHIVYTLAHHASVNLNAVKGTADRSDTLERFNPETVVHFTKMMEIMIDLGRRFNFKVGLFLQPHSYVSTKPFSDLESKYLSKVLTSEAAKADKQSLFDFYSSVKPEIARIRNSHHADRNVCVADVSDVFKSTKETVYIDTGHLNERGEEIVAARLVKELAACNLF